MKVEELQIHGSMFILFKKYIDNNYEKNTWIELSEATSTAQSKYEMHANYPAHELSALINKAANLKGLNQNEVTEKFGEYLVPDLLEIFKSYINPTWKTFEMLENTELVMHKAVRKEENKANPPILNVSRVHDNLLIIDYYSKRRMACLAIGIVRGIITFYNETDKVTVIPNTNPNDERVQIRVEFK